MKKRLVALIILVALVFGVTGCAGDALNTNNPFNKLKIDYASMDANGIEKYYEQAVDYANGLDENLINHINDIGYRLLQTANEDKSIISPIGSYMALLSIYAATTNQGITEFDEILDFSTVDPRIIYGDMREMLVHLNRIDANIQYYGANTIFVPHNRSMYNDYAALIFNNLFTDYNTVNYASPNLKKMNSWYENYTDNKFSTIVDSFSSDDSLVIVNAWDMHARWQTPVADADRIADIFYGESIEDYAYYNRTVGEFNIYEDDTVLVIGVPIGRGKTTVSYIMPKNEKLTDYIATTTVQQIDELINNAQLKAVEIMIPELNYSRENDLSAMLQELGLKTIFNEEDESVLGMVGDGYISGLYAKAQIRLGDTVSDIPKIDIYDEMGNKSFSSYEQAKINKPCIFIIKDDISGVNILTGAIKEPVID